MLKRLYILEDAAFPLDYVKRVLESGDRQDDRVLLGRANISIWQGRFDEAAMHFRRALELDPNCGPAKQGLKQISGQ